METKDINLTVSLISDLPQEPWKNGQGLTRELAKSCDTPMTWRLSSAQVQKSGPFSTYVNYERVICVLSGGPMILSHSDGKQKRLEALSAYKFSGDLKTQAQVESEVIDLNLFLLKGVVRGMIYTSSLSQGEEYQLPLCGIEHFVICLEGNGVVFERSEGSEICLNKNQFLRVTRRHKTEFPNLKVISHSKVLKIVWIPIQSL